MTNNQPASFPRREFSKRGNVGIDSFRFMGLRTLTQNENESILLHLV
jgi:hypothetical protein